MFISASKHDAGSWEECTALVFVLCVYVCGCMCVCVNAHVKCLRLGESRQRRELTQSFLDFQITSL